LDYVTAIRNSPRKRRTLNTDPHSNSTDLLRVAAIQMNACLDKQTNLASAEALVVEAAAAGNQLIVLPELFNLYGDLAVAANEAEPIDGATMVQMRAWASRHQVWLAGSIACRVSTAAKPANLAVVIDPNGQLLAQYAKIHLFDIDVPDKVTSRESDHLTPGNEVVTTELAGMQAGLAICYDLRFPELFRRLTEQSAELILLPSAFTKATGQLHWEILVRARAIENQAYVIAANQVGPHQPRGESFGHSMIVDPWGNVLASGSGSEEGVVSAVIERAKVLEARLQIPALANRKLH